MCCPGILNRQADYLQSRQAVDCCTYIVRDTVDFTSNASELLDFFRAHLYLEPVLKEALRKALYITRTGHFPRNLIPPQNQADPYLCWQISEWVVPISVAPRSQMGQLRSSDCLSCDCQTQYILIQHFDETIWNRLQSLILSGSHWPWGSMLHLEWVSWSPTSIRSKGQHSISNKFNWNSEELDQPTTPVPQAAWKLQLVLSGTVITTNEDFTILITVSSTIVCTIPPHTFSQFPFSLSRYYG